MSIEIAVVEAVSIEVKPVHCRTHRPEPLPAYAFATQRIQVTDHAGNKIEIVFHLAEGCTSLAEGAAVVLPAVEETEGVEQ